MMGNGLKIVGYQMKGRRKGETGPPKGYGGLMRSKTRRRPA